MNYNNFNWQKISDHLHTNDFARSKAPGRINLIGEHTDYNGGLVLPAAIDKYCYFGFVPNETNMVSIAALDIAEKIDIELGRLHKSSCEWANFLIGLLIEFRKKNTSLTGMNIAFTSEVPIGAGMSSSSALECAFIAGLNGLFECGLSNWEMIEMSKRSNHEFLGLKGGIMDQFAAFFGKRNQTILLNCDNLAYEYHQIHLSKYSWILVNTGVKHNNLTSRYGDRVSECAEALKCIQRHFSKAKNLSSITDISILKKEWFTKEKLLNRATFVIEENQRVRDFCVALKNEEYLKCGQLLYASHEGLSKKYEVSCIELDFLVDTLISEDSVLGSRMMGGGFGGCTINLVETTAISAIKEELEIAYLDKFDSSPDFYKIEISNGASFVTN